MSLLFDEICEQPSVLKKLASVNSKTVRAIADEYRNRGLDGVYFAARGTSDHACIYAQYLFGIAAGIPCTLGTPSVITKYGAKMRFGSDLVVGVSQSGKAEDVLAVLKQANEQGCVTVAVTNDESSPMAAEAKYHLFCSAGEEISIAATKTFTAQMYLLALLCAELSSDAGLSSALETIGDDAADLLRYAPPALEAKLVRYRYMTNAFILGRGLEYPIALEGALKILETNCIKMKGAAISDFYHGPIAQVCEGDLVIVISGEGPTFGDDAAMIKRLHEIGAEVFVITNSEQLYKSEKFGILTPMTDKYTAPFLFAICVQLFAYELTVIRGIDPNKSKVLNKITITK
ncbi:MAG: SIS domain-containing protein [Clostridia bacterium]|nr:SIS domain-containing protein [Clostridia bacterium]